MYTHKHSHSRITHLLPFEHVLVEVLLQLFVGQVDAQLLQVVCVKRLKAVDVQQPDGVPEQLVYRQFV